MDKEWSDEAQRIIDRGVAVFEQAAKLSIAEYTIVLDELVGEAEIRLECLKNEHGSV